MGPEEAVPRPSRRDDPESSFATVAASHRRCFWLDGGGAREWSGRRSIIGWLDDDDVSLTYDATRREVLRHVSGTAEVVADDIFAALESELAVGAPTDQWFGYFGYACRPDLPARVGGFETGASAPSSTTELPDGVWMRPGNIRLFNHLPSHPGTELRETVTGAPTEAERGKGAGSWLGVAAGARDERRLVDAAPALAGDDEDVASGPGSAGGRIPTEYSRAFARVQEHLHAGNSYEVNLTHRLDTESDLDPAAAYLRLRALNPAPYAGFLQHDVPGHRAWLLSSSPERYALVTADRMVETKPIKGTTPRGATAGEDAELRTRLATESKFRSENLMIVDLLRNDLAMVCDPGTVTVPVLMEVESYESVHQLVSTVRGRLRDDVSTVAALRTLFPAGSMTGAPKLRTMAIIEQVESSPRGPYAGAFGWISADGRADLGVVIRSLMTSGDGRYVLGTGGAITVHSGVAEEYAESQWKADRLLRVFDRGER